MGYTTQSYQLLVYLPLLLFYSQCSAKLCSHDQSSALLQFKQLFAFDKDSSDYCDVIQQISRPKMLSWKEDADCCSWDGVTCDSATGHVIGLDLSCSWLRGNIPSNTSLFFLLRLRELNLAFNDFNYSTISSGFTQFPSLTLLNLSFSNFMGSIPASLGNNITQLVSLDLSHNSFRGHIPSSFSNLQQLRYLDLRSNKFVCKIPASLGSSITQLAYLDLSFNSFSGHIPSSFSNLQQLRHLDLWGNEFVGKIPNMFTNLTQLSYLKLADNQLTGSIPSSIFELVNLANVDLSSNNLSGSVELYDFAKLKNLELLSLDSNLLQGPLPDLPPLIEYFSISNNNLTGEIPSSFCNLSTIQYFYLANNRLSGQIPQCLGNSTLRTLDLGMNNFQGSIPQSFAKGCNLTYLVLDSNLLQGPLLDLPPLIEYFSISNNNLTGEIPSSFCNLSTIQYFYLANNSLSGQIPQCLGNSTLRTLDLGMNNFQGSIPQSFAKGCNLTYLVLDSNLLQGPLLDLPPLIEYFSISSNNLTGEIPSSFCNLSSIQYFGLSNNSLSGQIPQCLGNSTLRTLDLGMNNFQGSIPQSFAKGCNLTKLFLDSNLLQGPLLDLPPLIQYFSISSNNLTGEISSSFCNLSSIQYFYLSNNSLSGQIPQCLGNSTLGTLDLGMNNLQGSIPQSFAKGCNLAYLDVGNNNLSGPIPDCLGNSTLEVLDMRMNKFSGSLPQTFAKSCALVSLNLIGNLLEGPLPPSLVNCQHLEVLDVGNNLIDDTFPHWLDVLPELQVLMLRSNRFKGPIGDTKTRVPFPKLRIIDLSHNRLTGVLPIWYLNSFKAMMHGDDNIIEVNYMRLSSSYSYYESIILTIKGNDIKMERILTTFATIDLSSNRFQGKIPEVVGKLNSLKGLNISHNNLTGAIPSSLRNMIELEFLDLSSNKLTGHIPMQLASLNYLSVLNLSNNQLEGLIPRGPQFNTFPNDSYAGNSGLCGFPLSKSCSIDEAPAPTTPTRFHEEDDAASWFDWKFAKMGYASGVVIGLSIGYMVFVTRRPRWFVRIIERKQSRKVRRVIGR